MIGIRSLFQSLIPVIFEVRTICICVTLDYISLHYRYSIYMPFILTICLVRTLVAAELTCDQASVSQQEINTCDVTNSAYKMCPFTPTIHFYTVKICDIYLLCILFNQFPSIR
jgi:hypothetical protein